MTTAEDKRIKKFIKNFFKHHSQLVVYICGFWLSSLKQSSHFINSLTRLTLLKIAPPYIAAPTSLLI